MNEKSLKVLEQYDIQVTDTKRGRGSYICETNLGKKLLLDYAGSEKKLEFVNQVLEVLDNRGYAFTDKTLKNREGNLITRDREENACILKDWYEGRECDTKSMADMEGAASGLAKLHQLLVYLPEDGEALKLYTAEDPGEEIRRHNRELRKVYAFIKKRQQKNEFEVRFLNCFSRFYEQAVEAEKWIRQSDYEALKKQSLQKGCLCHGSFHQHNIYYCGRRQIFISNFDKCRYDVQMTDLYQFLRKMMEKQDWEERIGHQILAAYDRVKPIEKREWGYLYARLFYPEKFWKLANQYYNRGKVWIPWQSAGKLKILEEQQEKRNAFLKTLEERKF